MRRVGPAPQDGSSYTTHLPEETHS
ncbi:hypothetical protein MICRO11B_760001 [Micrococcus luteus]|nr:hypothetical protein MICRO11B_480022 [Micrococcus luteus]VXB83562.1 hypothetical protein MICRO11B_760001 [Micrococcus luteus]